MLLPVAFSKLSSVVTSRLAKNYWLVTSLRKPACLPLMCESVSLTRVTCVLNDSAMQPRKRRQQKAAENLQKARQAKTSRVEEDTVEQSVTVDELG